MSAIRVELELADGSFTSRLIHAGESLQRFEQNVGQTVRSMSRMQDTSKGMLATMRDLSVVLGVASFAFHKMQQVATGFVLDIVKANAEMERLTVLMKSMSTAADPVADAAKNVKYLRDMAKEVPFSLKALTETFVKLKATGIDPMSGTMKNLADGIAGVGGTDEALKRISLGISQMAGKGVIQMEELRQQLGEQFPRAVELMARSMGVSMSKLIQEIGTGTVAAKPALDAFLREVERVYGGASKALMQTVTGQTQLMFTNLQEMALKIGEAGFFDAVKTQLMDLNKFMASDSAAKLAASFGRGLTSVVESLRGALDWVVKFRQEIELVGTALLVGFSAKLLIGGIVSMGAALGATKGRISELRAEYALLQRQVAAANVANAGASIGVVAGGAIARTGATLRILGSALAAFSGWIPLVVTGLTVAASYFGLFSNKAREAWQELERFGAASRKAAEDGGKFVRDEEQKLKDLEERRNALQKRMGSRVLGTSNYTSVEEKRFVDTQKALEKQRKLVAELQAAEKGFLSQGEARDAERTADKTMDQLDKELNVIRLDYDKRGVARDRFLQEETRRITDAGRSSKAFSENFTKESLQLTIETYEQRLAVIEQFWDAASEKERTGNSAERASAQVELRRLAIQRADTMRDLEAQRAQKGGVEKNTKVMDDKALYDKGVAFLKNVQAEIAGAQASLMGLNPMVAELGKRLDDLKFGDGLNEDVKELHKNLIAATNQQQKLNDLVDGRKKFDSDVQSAIVALENEKLEMLTDGMSKADAIETKLRLGVYKGLGGNYDKLSKELKDLGVDLTSLDRNAKSLASTLKGETFGDQVLAAVNKIGEVFSNLARNAGAFVETLQKTPTVGAGAGAGVPGGPRGTATTAGYSDVELMARTVYGEAAREGREGWLAVANVIVNRLNEGFGGKKTLEEIILAPKQFSVWNEGDRAGAKARALPSDDPTLTAIRELVVSVLAGNERDNTGGANHYLNPTTADRSNVEGWFSRLFNKIAIGAHVFGNNKAVPAGRADVVNTRAGLTEDRQEQLARLRTVEIENELVRLRKNMSDSTKEMVKDIEKANNNAGGLESNYSKIIANIKEGKYAFGKDPAAEGYRELIEWAKKADEAENALAQRRKIRTEGERAKENIAKQLRDAIDKGELNEKMLLDPDGLKYSEAYLREFKKLREELIDIKNLEGENSEAYKQAYEKRLEILQRFRNSEASGRALTYAREAPAERAALLPTLEGARLLYEAKREGLRKELEAIVGNGEEQVAARAAILQKMLRLDQGYQQSTPFGRMFKEWGDTGQNWQNQFVGMMNGAVDAVAQFVATGKLDFKSMLASWAQDLIKLAMKALLSNVFKNLTSGGAGGGNIISTAMSFFGMAHTGAIIGSENAGSKMVNPMVFAGAPRFHTGGLVGDEVPIIAKKNEGVFTPGQMKSLGLMANSGMSSRGGMMVNAPITINGSAGTPEQNDDLAKKMQRSLESTMRSVVVDEIMRQKKPGNMLSS